MRRHDTCRALRKDYCSIFAQFSEGRQVKGLVCFPAAERYALLRNRSEIKTMKREADSRLRLWL